MNAMELYNTIQERSRNLDVGAEIRIHHRDYNKLSALKPVDLVSAGYGNEKAEEVSSALFAGDYGPLERTMGLKIIKDSSISEIR